MARQRFLFVLFDGLRRDMVGPRLMPILHRFRKTWCEYPNSSSVFPSETRVQASSFVTGACPGGSALVTGCNDGAGHGIMGNAFYDPVLGFDRALDTSDDERMAQAGRIYGRVQKAEALGKVLARSDRKFAVLSTGTIGNVRLLNTSAADLDQPVFSTRRPAISHPPADIAAINERFGPVPEAAFPNVAVNDYATTLLLDHYLPVHDADVQVIWYNEPDLTYHYRGIGSAASEAAASGMDAAFARILDWWDSEGRANGWSIIAASDHAQITVTDQVRVLDKLSEAGFAAGHAIGPDCDIAVTPGYSGKITVRDRDPALILRALRFLQEQDWCGVTLTRSGGNGSLPMGAINVLNERSPDISFVLRTTDGANEYGYAGTCIADNPDIPPGGGMHGGLHPAEINNLLVLGGDAIRHAAILDVPAGNVDIAPTILWHLGIAIPPTVTGRPLTEAFGAGGRPPAWRETIRHAAAGGYSQTLTVSDVDGAVANYIRGAKRIS